MKVSDSPMSCGNESVYLHTVVKSEEASTYQELDISKNAYQNTTIRWSTHTFCIFFSNEKHVNMCVKKNKKIKTCTIILNKHTNMTESPYKINLVNCIEWHFR